MSEVETKTVRRTWIANDQFGGTYIEEWDEQVPMSHAEVRKAERERVLTVLRRTLDNTSLDNGTCDIIFNRVKIALGEPL